jgi:hypothetical protein
MVVQAMAWPTIGRMASLLATMPPGALAQLERALLAGDVPLNVDDDVAIAGARVAAAEGWLMPIGDAASSKSFELMSPLIRNIALVQLASMRLRPLTDALPVDAAGVLDMAAVVRALLPHFSAEGMRAAQSLSTKRTSASALASKDTVPNEAAYHFQLFTGLRQWLTLWNHADVFPEADVHLQGMSKKYADILLVGRRVQSPPKHIVELVASASVRAIEEHYARTVKYMAAHATDRGTCITFTAVASAADTAVAAATLAWPAQDELATGLVAIHVVHDLAWTTATVVSQRRGQTASSQQVDLVKQ